MVDVSLPISIPTAVAIAVGGGLAGIVALAVAIRRGMSRSRVGEDFVVVYKPDGISTSYSVEVLVPPSLYTYSCQSTELCLMVARSPPIVFQDPRTKRLRRMWIAVEQEGLALTMSPEEIHTISVAAEALGNPKTDDILSLVRMAIEKKSYGNAVRLPNGFRIAFTYTVYPSVVNVLTDILRSDAVALSSILAALRAAREAKTLAEAIAIRKGVEIRKIVQWGILALLIAISIAVAMSFVGR